MQEIFREIPSVNEILEDKDVLELLNRFGKTRVTEEIRKTIQEYRTRINVNINDMEIENSRQGIKTHIIRRLNEILQERSKLGLKRVINATGIIIHTNLGRAPLPQRALEAVCEVSKGYSNLEYDIEKGTRGSRHEHIEELICNITGAESAMVVNNNAAAVFLTLNTISGGKEIIVSRGQQVEIGGSFRIPDIIAGSGAKMIEVGTTNKTHLNDYQRAITEETAMLLKVHTSNFKIIGFTEQVDLEPLVQLGHQHGLYVMEDLGSGSMIDLSSFGLPSEPTVQESIAKGADIVTFSGDKLLGGPQAGIIAGKRELVDRIKANPLARMVRCDKMTIAALFALLEIYARNDGLIAQIPVLEMLAMTEQQLEEKAAELMNILEGVIKDKCALRIIDEHDEAGGGALPGITLKGKAVALSPFSINANMLQVRLRNGQIPVICTVKGNEVLLNVRTLNTEDYIAITGCVDKVLRDV